MQIKVILFQVGDLQLGPAALLRNVPRGGGQVPEGGENFGLS